MDANASDNPEPIAATLNASTHVRQHLARLTTLLRLLDPGSPFQPILAGSVDLVAWLAAFGIAADALETNLQALARDLSAPSAARLNAAGSKLFSLAHLVCDTPRLHASAPPGSADDLPELLGLDLGLTASPEEQHALQNALHTAGSFRQQHKAQLALLHTTLAASIQHLKKTAEKRMGLLWLMKKRAANSPVFRERFGRLTEDLESALAKAADAVDKPWASSRHDLEWLRIRLTHSLPGEIDAMLREVIPRRKQPSTNPSRRPGPPNRDQIKKAFGLAADSFLQTLASLCNIYATEESYPFFALLSQPLALLSQALDEAGVAPGHSTVPHDQGRIIDAIRDLDCTVISSSLVNEWDRIVGTGDTYLCEIIVAALHHLERPGDEQAAEQVAFAFSEQAMALWLAKGTYPGANPNLEASRTLDTEIRRVRRALKDLRHVGAAVHGRKHWTPLPDKCRTTAANRLWTINPLLAAHERFRGITTSPIAMPDSQRGDRASRPRPSRKNRGSRPRR
jgi:hypothetical protein